MHGNFIIKVVITLKVTRKSKFKPSQMILGTIAAECSKYSIWCLCTINDTIEHVPTKFDEEEKHIFLNNKIIMHEISL